MTNTFSVELRSISGSNSHQYDIKLQKIRKRIINRLLCTKSILEKANALNIVNILSPSIIKTIAEDEMLPENIAETILKQFLKQIKTFSCFLDKYSVSWNYTPRAIYRKSRIYLHKVHKIAPVFNYKRARFNLRALNTFFHRIVVWPRISTQLALAIYITDKKDPLRKQKLKPGNIRAITHCSAYAFYQNKNILIDKGVLNPDE